MHSFCARALHSDVFPVPGGPALTSVTVTNTHTMEHSPCSSMTLFHEIRLESMPLSDCDIRMYSQGYHTTMHTYLSENSSVVSAYLSSCMCIVITWLQAPLTLSLTSMS